MLRKKKTQRHLPRPLYGGNTRRRGMLSKTLQRKKERKKKETQGTARKNNQPTLQRPARAPSLQGIKSAVGQIERYVFRVTHTTHFCYTSTGPLLLLFSFCFLNTTMPTDDEN